MRDKLKVCNLVITECNLYQDVLGDALKGVKTETVYLLKRDSVASNPQLRK